MISVCIATYNGEKYIEEQISSILCQLGEGDEIIVSDDGSTDGTLEILYSFKDERIKVYINDNCHDVTRNFVNAISHSKGEFIFLADQDDIWLENKVELCMEILKENDAVMHNLLFMDASGKRIGKDFFSMRKPSKSLFCNIYKNTFTGCSMAFRREMLQYVMPIPENVPMYDQWIGILASHYRRLEIIDDCLICCRRHETNISFNGEGKSSLSLWNQLSNRAILALLLIKRFCIR